MEQLNGNEIQKPPNRMSSEAEATFRDLITISCGALAVILLYVIINYPGDKIIAPGCDALHPKLMDTMVVFEYEDALLDRGIRLTKDAQDPITGQNLNIDPISRAGGSGLCFRPSEAKMVEDIIAGK